MCLYTPEFLNLVVRGWVFIGFFFFFNFKLNLLWHACSVVCLCTMSSFSHPSLRKVISLCLVCMAGQQGESYCLWACKSSLLPSRRKVALLGSWSLLFLLTGLSPWWCSPSPLQRRTFGPILMSCVLNYLYLLLETFCFYTRKANLYDSAASSATKTT